MSACGVDGLIFWFLYVKEDAPSTAPETPRYTEQDAQETIDVFGHRSLGPGYTFADLWESRVRAAMVPLEEGVLDGPWNSGGRVVLMGDTVMKVSISNSTELIQDSADCSVAGDCQCGTGCKHTRRGSVPSGERALLSLERLALPLARGSSGCLSEL